MPIRLAASSTTPAQDWAIAAANPNTKISHRCHTSELSTAIHCRMRLICAWSVLLCIVCAFMVVHRPAHSRNEWVSLLKQPRIQSIVPPSEFIIEDLYKQKYRAQSTQDDFVDKLVFRGKRNGTFFEFGARDGEVDSNTYFFEKHLGWRGILVEPEPKLISRCVIKRPRAKCIESLVCTNATPSVPFTSIQDSAGMPVGLSRAALAPDEPARAIEHGFLHKDAEARCSSIVELAHQASAPSGHLDYLSADCEGCEWAVLKLILEEVSSGRLRVDVIQLEINTHETHPLNQMISAFTATGYIGPFCIGQDWVFVRKKALPSDVHDYFSDGREPEPVIPLQCVDTSPGCPQCRQWVCKRKILLRRRSRHRKTSEQFGDFCLNDCSAVACSAPDRFRLQTITS